MRIILLCVILMYCMSEAMATSAPTEAPTQAPSQLPSLGPSFVPTACPSINPSFVPTVIPTVLPSTPPSISPTITPTIVPTTIPSAEPSYSMRPSMAPTILPSALPSQPPSILPSAVPTTTTPTVVPTTSLPTVEPSLAPSVLPTLGPTELPTVIPSLAPSALPTLAPSLPPTYITIVFETTVTLQNVSSTSWSTVSEAVLIDSLAETLFINSDQISYVSESAHMWSSSNFELKPVFQLVLHTSDYYSDLHNASALYGAVTSTMHASAENGGFVFAVKYYARLNHEYNLLNVSSASFSNSDYTVGEPSTSSSHHKKLSTQDKVGIYLGVSFAVTILMAYCFFYTFCVCLYPKDLEKKIRAFGGNRERRYSGDIEGQPDVNFWLKEYDRELNELDSLSDQLQYLVHVQDTSATEECLTECEAKITSVTDIQVSFYLELRLVKDREVRLRLDAKAKLMEDQYAEIVKFVNRVRGKHVQKYESSSMYQQMKLRIEELESVMLMSEDIVTHEREMTAQAVAQSISKGNVSSQFVSDMQAELQRNKEENQRLRQMIEVKTMTSSGREVDPSGSADLNRLQSQLAKAADEIDLILTENEKLQKASQAVEKSRDDVIAELVMQKVVNGNVANEIEETKLELHKLRKKAEAIESQRAAKGLPPAGLLAPTVGASTASTSTGSPGGGTGLTVGQDAVSRRLNLEERLAEHQQRRMSMSGGSAAMPPPLVTGSVTVAAATTAPAAAPRRPVSPDYMTPSRPVGGMVSNSSYDSLNSGGSSALTSTQMRGVAYPNSATSNYGNNNTSSSSSAGGGGSGGGGTSGSMMRGFGSNNNALGTGGRGVATGRGGGRGNNTTGPSTNSFRPPNPNSNNRNYSGY